MYERQRFVLDAEHTPAAFAELCRRCGISRKTGYKWLDRYARLGPESLADRSHRPAACPHATAPAVVREILQLRRAWRWGARKLHELLAEAHPGESVPAIPTIHRILVRHGRVRRRRRSQVRAHRGCPQTRSPGPMSSGRSTSRASLSWAMGATATRSPYKTPTRAICSPATG